MLEGNCTSNIESTLNARDGSYSWNSNWRRDKEPPLGRVSLEVMEAKAHLSCSFPVALV